MEARYVIERHHSCDETHGATEVGRVGFSIDEQVFWTDSYQFPGDNSIEFQRKQLYAQSIVDALNAGFSTP